MFVGASLLVTFKALSASLLRALHLVHRLTECSEAENQCLYVVQRFIYKRLVSGFVKVDIDTLELQASGACRVVALEESASQDAFHRRWQSSLVTSEVLLINLTHDCTFSLMYTTAVICQRSDCGQIRCSTCPFLYIRVITTCFLIDREIRSCWVLI